MGGSSSSRLVDRTMPRTVLVNWCDCSSTLIVGFVSSVLGIWLGLSSTLSARCDVPGQLFVSAVPGRPVTFSLTGVCSLFPLVLKVTEGASINRVGTPRLTPGDAWHPGCQPGGSGITTCAGNFATIWTDVTLTSSWTIVAECGNKVVGGAFYTWATPWRPPAT